VGQAGGVLEQVHKADRALFVVGWQFGDVFADVIGQGQFARQFQQKDRKGGDRLGPGSQFKGRFRCYRVLFVYIGQSVALFQQHLVLFDDEDRGPRALRIDDAADDAVQGAKDVILGGVLGETQDRGNDDKRQSQKDGSHGGLLGVSAWKGRVSSSVR